jgi:succinoglycan biosynthesis transport protein ExoP
MQPDRYPARQRSKDSLSLYQERELTLRDLVQMFRRRRTIVYVTTSAIFALAVLYCIVSTRRYEGTGTIQVQRESSDGLDLDSLMGSGGNPPDALEADINLQTQASILQSNELALRAIKKLGLEKTRDFGSSSSESAVPLEKSPERLAKALNTFHKNLSVKPLGGTRLIEVGYLNPDPELAAAVVNQLVQELVDYSFETRYKATEAASQSLSKQLAECNASPVSTALERRTPRVASKRIPRYWISSKEQLLP